MGVAMRGNLKLMLSCGAAVAALMTGAAPAFAIAAVAGFSGTPAVGQSVSSLVRATPFAVLMPGCTSSYEASSPCARVS